MRISYSYQYSTNQDYILNVVFICTKCNEKIERSLGPRSEYEITSIYAEDEKMEELEGIKLCDPETNTKPFFSDRCDKYKRRERRQEDDHARYTVDPKWESK